MDDYSDIYEKYSLIVNECCTSSKKWAGIPSPTDKHFHASLLFTKLCTISVSIKNLSPSEPGDNDSWDYSSVASLTWNLIEAYLTFFYLCIDDCSSEEWKARKQLMNLHDHMSRKKMFKAIGEEYEINEEAKNIKSNIIAELENNSWFQNLSAKQQKHFLKGNTPFFKSKNEIVSLSDGDVGRFRFRYRFLSNNVHTFPMGFYRMTDGERGRGVESRIEVQYTGICLVWSIEYLEKADREFNNLFSSHS